VTSEEYKSYTHISDLSRPETSDTEEFPYLRKLDAMFSKRAALRTQRTGSWLTLSSERVAFSFQLEAPNSTPRPRISVIPRLHLTGRPREAICRALQKYFRILHHWRAVKSDLKPAINHHGHGFLHEEWQKPFTWEEDVRVPGICQYPAYTALPRHTDSFRSDPFSSPFSM
jgi:hypothetical protein